MQNELKITKQKSRLLQFVASAHAIAGVETVDAKAHFGPESTGGEDPKHKQVRGCRAVIVNYQIASVY